MTDKTYMVKEPQQSRLGGWLCQVLEGGEVIYETFQISKKWAFQEAVMWLHDKTDGKLIRVDEQQATESPPEESPQQ